MLVRQLPGFTSKPISDLPSPSGLHITLLHCESQPTGKTLPVQFYADFSMSRTCLPCIRWDQPVKFLVWFCKCTVAILTVTTESGKAVCRLVLVDSVPRSAANEQACWCTQNLGNSKFWPSQVALRNRDQCQQFFLSRCRPFLELLSDSILITNKGLMT